MTREEEILSEAKKHYSDNIRCYDAFLHGVEFAEEHPKNVWHYASEMPNNHSYLMLMVDRYTIKTDYVPACLKHCQLNRGNWDEFAKDANIRQWAYVSDLLPKIDEL